MLGSVTAVQSQWMRLQRTAALYGQYLSPDDAFLAARGLRTLSVRLRQHEASALKVAHWLKEQPQVARVLHPAFESCPGHEFWRRDFSGSTGLFSFILSGGDEAARDALIDSLELFGIGYSWGGFESLAVPADATRTANKPQYEGPLVRLQVGLEGADDLIADLHQALMKYPATRVNGGDPSSY
jgi:cystathionine beta-lyase